MAESADYREGEEELQAGTRGNLLEIVDEEITIRRPGYQGGGETPGSRAAEPRDRATGPWDLEAEGGRREERRMRGDERLKGGEDEGPTLGWGNVHEGKRSVRPKTTRTQHRPSGDGPTEGRAGSEMSSAGDGTFTASQIRTAFRHLARDADGDRTFTASQMTAALQHLNRDTGGEQEREEEGKEENEAATDRLTAALKHICIGGKETEEKESKTGATLHKGGGDQAEKPIIKPTKFDGTGDLSDYFSHFDLCVRANAWTEAEAGMFLGLSLGGQARRLLTGLKPATAEGYKKLRTALMLRFEPPKQTETYKMLLRTRKRKGGEDMQALQEDLTKYTRMAYPEADAKTVDALVLDKFLLALGDNRLRQWVYQMQPADLQTAVMTAISAEAYLANDEEDKPKVRGADATLSEHMKTSADRIERIAAAVEGLSRKVDQNAGGNTGSQSKRKGPANSGCYYCGVEGHFKRECPQLVKKTPQGEGAPEAHTSVQGESKASGN